MKNLCNLVCFTAFSPLILIVLQFGITWEGIGLLLMLSPYGICGWFAWRGIIRKMELDIWNTGALLIVVMIYSYQLGKGMFILRKYSDFIYQYPWYYFLFNLILIISWILYSNRKYFRNEENNTD